MTEPSRHPDDASRPDALRLVSPTGVATVESLVEQARLAEEGGQPETARDFYERALHSLDPRAGGEFVASLLLGIGRTHLDTENFSAALECIGSVLALNPDHGSDSTIGAALELRGRVHLSQGALAEAQDDFLASRERALQGVPRNSLPREAQIWRRSRWSAVSFQQPCCYTRHAFPSPDFLEMTPLSR